MTKKLFDITDSSAAGVVVAIDVEAARDPVTINQQGLGVVAFADSVINTVKEQRSMEPAILLHDIESRPPKLVIDSMSALVDEARTVDAIPALSKLKGTLSTKPSKTHVILEDTKIAPSPLVVMSGKNFKQAYREQLVKIIYDGPRNGNTDAIMSLTRVFDFLNHTNGNVQLSSSKFKRRLNDIVQVLNAFFRSQYVVLDSIVSMVKDEVADNQPTSVYDSKMADVSRHANTSAVVNNPPEDIFEYPTR